MGWLVCPAARVGVRGTVRAGSMHTATRPAVLAPSEWSGGDRACVVHTKMHSLYTKCLIFAFSPFSPLEEKPRPDFSALWLGGPSAGQAFADGFAQSERRILDKTYDLKYTVYRLYRIGISRVPIRCF